MILTSNSNYLLKQHQPVDLSNGKVLCFFFCGRAEFLNIIQFSFSFKRLKYSSVVTEENHKKPQDSLLPGTDFNPGHIK
jgi:hypothetical protein